VRNAKTFQIRKNLAVTVAELTVVQVLEIFWLMGDFFYPTEFEAFLQAHRVDALAKARELVSFTPDFDLEKLTSEEQQALMTHFVEVNQAFFNGSGETQTHNAHGIEQPDLSGFEHYQALSAMVNALVRLKHTEVLSYPVSLLNAVVAEIGKDN